jgi:hypothetical protein
VVDSLTVEVSSKEFDDALNSAKQGALGMDSVDAKML